MKNLFLVILILIVICSSGPVLDFCYKVNAYICANSEPITNWIANTFENLFNDWRQASGQ